MTTLRAEVDVKKKAIAQSLVNLPQRERLFTNPLNDNQNMVTSIELQKWRTVHWGASHIYFRISPLS